MSSSSAVYHIQGGEDARHLAYIHGMERRRAPEKSRGKAALCSSGLLLGALLCALSTSACLSFKPVIVAPKTELEIQIVGHFERLERELPLGRPASAPASMGPAQRALLQAFLDRAYLAAELDSLRERGLVAELPSGQLGLDRNKARREGVAPDSIKGLVDRENDARERIARGLVATEKGLSQKDLPLIRRLLGEHIAKQPGASH